MEQYAEFRLLPDPEFSVHHLMNALFAKLHRALVDLNNPQIGVTFPEAGAKAKGMGSILRLHGAGSVLHPFLQESWFRSVRDHVESSGVQRVPDDCSYMQVRRVQPLGGSDLRRLRRRLITRTGCSVEEAEQRIPNVAAERLALPFLSLRSTSTGQVYRLFIQQMPAPERVDGEFNTFGISKTATLPLFD
ncbi:type I-F CRISPR-associated endoribonuclease Cas6/Csy4 [Abyssibacter profundi]|uniref:Type I-F CRISPR-associated endoribonuclease Cas6/Csy4 n=1 Tax=Abyssibacter profundi TaxID=2182787 RepID=A0A363UNL7_9GAMM|nr:type I-F CRISPR-associated endoribonuclease Cas6/Csy4 [Abyssibacter profundi]PWN57040.1 type I-F CRISPR-associated endoribonuclease Cas6/Csy4 [Abyssibacter profundi]